MAVQGRWANMPDNALDEGFVLWDERGIYARPSQYRFLTTLQQGPPTGQWASTEVPFSLFQDHLQLLILPTAGGMDAVCVSSEPLCQVSRGAVLQQRSKLSA